MTREIDARTNREILVAIDVKVETLSECFDKVRLDVDANKKDIAQAKGMWKAVATVFGVIGVVVGWIVSCFKS